MVIVCAALFIAGATSTALATEPSDDFTWFNSCAVLRDPGSTLGNSGDVRGKYLVTSTDSDSMLHVNDLSNGTQSDLADGAIAQTDPQIDQAVLVCEEQFGPGDYTLKWWDLYDKSSYEITTTSYAIKPYISGDTAAFLAQSAPGTWDVFVHKIYSGTTTQVTTGGGYTGVRIWGPYLAFVDSASQLHLYDLRNAADTVVAGPADGLEVCDFDEGLILYTSESALDYSDLYAYDMPSGDTLVVAATHLDEGSGAVCGRQIVYHAAGIDPVVTVGSLAYDTGTGRTETIGDSPSFVLGADENNFAIFDIGSDRGVHLYTPNRSSAIAWSTFSGAYAGTGMLEGMLTDRSIGLDARQLRLQMSTDGYTWTELAPVTTDADGYWTATTPAITRLTYFRTLYDGNYHTLPTQLSVTGDFTTMVPRAKLGTLGASSRMKLNKTYTVGLAISPSQKDQHAQGYFEAYRRSGSKWVDRKRFTASFTTTGAKGSVKLPKRGTWRVRFIFGMSDINRPTTGSWKTVTVY
ncbi:MAG: hypothetical protein HGB10_02565 [Coriobacteriia bacterium]|nr:hypothetical protein [Coriobacteriia bacterium]